MYKLRKEGLKMKQSIAINDPSITVDQNGTTNIEVDVQVRILNKRSLKAVVKLTYAGIVINDIKILERRGKIDIVFPQKPFVYNGIERQISVAFPGVSNLSSQFNHVILKAYGEAALENQNSAIENVLK